MPLPEALSHVRRCPGMYFSPVEFHVASAFVEGFNLASNGGLLAGFREWLVANHGGAPNLAWSAIVQSLLERETEQRDGAASVGRLFELLEGFLRERDTPEGLRRIYAHYEKWLRKQPWYGPLAPEWISDK